MITPDLTGGPVGDAVKPLRPLFVWGLLGFVALELLFTFFDWFVPSSSDSLLSRSYYADFTTLITIALPLVAILIATQITPVLGLSKLAATVALIEYAVIIGLGALTFLIGLGYTFEGVDNLSSLLGAFGHIASGLAELVLALLAGYAVLRVFLSLGGRLPSVGTPATPPAPPGPAA